MKAIGYIRVSTIGQVDGEGLGVQRDKIAGWCRYQQVELAEVYEDAGISGASMDRPGLQQGLARVLELGDQGVFVVARLDRLGRNAIEVQVTLRDLLARGVRVVAIADGIDTSSGMGSSIVKLLVSILSSFAELEREVIRTRLLDGRKRARQERRVYAAEPHLGLRVHDDGETLVEATEELGAIRRASELRKFGHSYRSIARTLDSEGFRPRRAPVWQAAVVRRMVLREPQAS
jgi:DNA invertase Pin-like site-specific DNA recombinase